MRRTVSILLCVLAYIFSPLRSLLEAQASPSNGEARIIAGRIPDRVVPGKPAPAPRLPDGKPDLGNGKGSWNPRIIENISGVGPGAPERNAVEKVIDVPFRPWALQVYEKRLADLQKDDPESRCLPPGIPRLYQTPFPFQIFQLTDRVLFVFEGGAHLWRSVFTDGRPHLKDPNPSYLGDSIGHWDGDTLVVDTIGFNDRTWLDQDGHPHTEALHTMERFRRTDEETLHYEVTIEDAGAYTRSWTTSYTIPWAPRVEPMEYVCNENNVDLPHMIGK
jgi:hypothetical protein